MAAHAPIKMYNADFCPFGNRAWIAALEKEVPLEWVETNLFNKPADFLKASPGGTVPCIEFQGHGMPESLELARFFEDEYHTGTNLMPKSAYGRYQANCLIKKYDANFYGPMYAALFAQAPEKQKEQLDKVVAVMKDMNEDLKKSGGPFFLGEQFSLVDVSIFPFMERTLVVVGHYRNFSMPKEFEALHRWYEACLQRPSIKTVTGPRQDRSLRVHPFPSSAREKYLQEVYEMYALDKKAEYSERLKHVKGPLADK